MKQKISVVGGVIVLLTISFIYLYPQLTQPPRPTEFKNVVITLERTQCYGMCPVYKLKIFGDGTLVYEGEKFVNITGKQISKISKNKVKELVDEFYNANYFSLKDSYEEYMVTDMPSAITSITIDGKTKIVKHYLGDMDAPKELTELEDKIDEISNSKRWIEGK